MNDEIVKIRKKLSDHARLLLLSIYERGEVDWDTGEIKRWWVPPSGNKICYINATHEQVSVSGSGTASALKGLTTKGLIKPAGKSPDCNRDYWFTVTERGIEVVQEILHPND